MCSGNSLGDIIVFYLFLNFSFGKDIQKIFSYSTSPGSHSSSFSNDQNLTLNWFQTSKRTNPIISPKHCNNHTQPGSDQSIQCHSHSRVRPGPQGVPSTCHSKVEFSLLGAQPAHASQNLSSSVQHPFSLVTTTSFIGRNLGTQYLMKAPDVCPLLVKSSERG